MEFLWKLGAGAVLAISALCVAGIACQVEEPGGTDKFASGGTEAIAPPSGKYYLGTTSSAYRVARYISMNGTPMNDTSDIANTEIEIYTEVDFSSGKPVVNVKTSASSSECDQIPADEFSHLPPRSGYQGVWQAEWTNNADQTFEVNVFQTGTDSKYPGVMRLEMHVTFDKRINGNMTKISYSHISQHGLSRADDEEPSYSSDISPEKVSGQFGSGDNCGDSDSEFNTNVEN